jgi:hypothetical protein
MDVVVYFSASTSATFMRIAALTGLGLIICGCAHGPVPQRPERWRQAAPTSACLSDARRREPSEGSPIVLEAKFKAELLRQLEENLQNLHEPFCWYEISPSEVLLAAGSTCSCPVDFHFRGVASNWSLSRIEVRACDARCDDLDRIDPAA